MSLSFVGEGLICLNRISAIAPPKKRSKNDARGRDRVEKFREIVAGLELAAKH